MDVKLGEYSHYSERSFIKVLPESSGVIRGHTSIKDCMDLKLCGCTHHLERIILLVLLGSSDIRLY